MDVDNGTSDDPQTDIEQSLLQQFSCLGTRDKDELIQQLQKLLPSQLNDYSAAFFLDMNNWNLQAAICSYLDIEYPNRVPSMTLVPDPVTSESENIEPNASFQKTWHVQNSGNEQWPIGCYAQCAVDNCFKGKQVSVPCLRPGEDGYITVEMTSPASPGVYQSKWRLSTMSGSYFGDPLWIIMTVVEESTIALTQQLSHFSELGSPLPQPQASHNPFVTQRSSNENAQEESPPDPMDSMTW